MAVQRRRSAARKDGRTCSGRDGELSAGGRRAASGRLVLHGGVQLAGGVFVLGPSTSEASGSLALAAREPRGFLPKMGAGRLFTMSSDGDLARSDGPDLSQVVYEANLNEIDLLVDKYKNHAPTPIFKRVSPK